MKRKDHPSLDNLIAMGVNKKVIEASNLSEEEFEVFGNLTASNFLFVLLKPDKNIDEAFSLLVSLFRTEPIKFLQLSNYVPSWIKEKITESVQSDNEINSESESNILLDDESKLLIYKARLTERGISDETIDSNNLCPNELEIFSLPEVINLICTINEKYNEKDINKAFKTALKMFRADNDTFSCLCDDPIAVLEEYQDLQEEIVSDSEVEVLLTTNVNLSGDA